MCSSLLVLCYIHVYVDNICDPLFFFGHKIMCALCCNSHNYFRSMRSSFSKFVDILALHFVQKMAPYEFMINVDCLLIVPRLIM